MAGPERSVAEQQRHPRTTEAPDGEPEDRPRPHRRVGWRGPRACGAHAEALLEGIEATAYARAPDRSGYQGQVSAAAPNSMKSCLAGGLRPRDGR